MDVHTGSRDSIFLPEYLSSLCDTNRRAGGHYLQGRIGSPKEKYVQSDLQGG